MTNINTILIRLITGLILLQFCSCSEKKILPEETFIKIYVDILVAEDTTSERSVTTDSLKSVVLNKYNTSDILYRNTVDYYNESAERWEKFFDKAVAYVEKLKTKNDE